MATNSSLDRHPSTKKKALFRLGRIFAKRKSPLPESAPEQTISPTRTVVSLPNSSSASTTSLTSSGSLEFAFDNAKLAADTRAHISDSCISNFSARPNPASDPSSRKTSSHLLGRHLSVNNGLMDLAGIDRLCIDQERRRRSDGSEGTSVHRSGDENGSRNANANENENNDSDEYLSMEPMRRSAGRSSLGSSSATLVEEGTRGGGSTRRSTSTSRRLRKTEKPPEPKLVPRFILHEDGTHEHHLRNIRRQEKLGQMIKDLLGAKKLRSKAVSAIPKILSSSNLAQLDKEAQETVDAVNSTVHDRKLPPTLFATLLNQVKEGGVNVYTHRGEAIQQPRDLISVDGSKYESQSKLLKRQLKGSQAKSVEKPAGESFFERYGTCQEIVGRGSFGVVRIAHKKVKRTGNQASGAAGEHMYAVKEFKKRPSESEKKYSRRLTNEFCISSSLKHPGLIDTYDLLRDAKGDYCEVMEYCSGGDLYSLIITAGRLEYAEADCFFKQLVRAVHYMHQMGVAHRDLKPENILLTSDGTIKITDFGNAECFKMAWEDDVQPASGVCGSSPYIAPEEYIQSEFDPRPVDIWSCGVIYMAMRTGRQLWKAAKDEDEFYSVYLAKRKDAKGYEPIEALKRARCRNVIYSILDPVPGRRITSLEILNSEWVRQINCCKS